MATPRWRADPSARTLFIGLNWEWPATVPPVDIDASVFLLDTAGVVRDDRDFVFYNQETDASGAVYRLSAAELDPAHDRDGFVVTLPALSDDVQRLAFACHWMPLAPATPPLARCPGYKPASSTATAAGNFFIIAAAANWARKPRW